MTQLNQSNVGNERYKFGATQTPPRFAPPAPNALPVSERLSYQDQNLLGRRNNPH